MGRTRILILAVAAVAAVGLALILRGVMGGGERTAVATVSAPVAAQPSARVLVAARDLPPGTRLTAADMAWREWPMDGLNVSYITDGAVAAPRLQPVAATTPAAGAEAPAAAEAAAATPAPEGSAPEGAAAAAQAQQTSTERFMGMISGNPGGAMAALEGMTVREMVLQGEPIVERKLVRAGDSGFMAVVLQPGMRAMAIPVSVETAAGGFILPGDHVDVLLSRQVQGASSTTEFTSSTVLRNIRVLAVDQTVTPAADAQTVVGATATLEVGPREAEVLALAKAQGTLALVLRSYADMDAPSGVGSMGGVPTQTGAGARPIRVWRAGQPTEVAQR